MRVAQRRRRRHRGDHRVALARLERIDQRIPGARLDRAADLQLLADRARDLDVEAGQRAVGTGEIERGIIVVGQEADRAEPRNVGPFEMQRRVPEARRRVGERRPRQHGEDEKQPARKSAGAGAAPVDAVADRVRREAPFPPGIAATQRSAVGDRAYRNAVATASTNSPLSSPWFPALCFVTLMPPRTPAGRLGQATPRPPRSSRPGVTRSSSGLGRGRDGV